ncbi:MAG TPA: hypothetical protein VFS29_12380 [Motilibacteraceae bacterium]|nr:hypothetical protein [Motilibacteraceae bacterium]
MSAPRPLLAASWWLVRRRLLVPAVVAVAAAVALTGLDAGWGPRVLRAAGVLSAVALTAATDDPCGEPAAASPYPRSLRTVARVAGAGAVVVPAWVLVAVVAAVRADVPLAVPALEALGLGAAGLALGAGLRAWRDVHAPGYAAALGVLALAVATAVLPPWYALTPVQQWGPPWQATELRWLGVLVAAVGVLAAALRDPLGRSPVPSGSGPST